MRLIEDITGVSKSQVYRILTEDLKLRKVCARFVPHSLNDNKKRARVLHAQDIISTIDNPNSLKIIVTGDETWCFQYELRNTRAQCIEKFRKTNTKKNAPTEIKSENHDLHFLRFR